MNSSFLPKLLCQVVESLQPADLIEQPLFVAFLCSLQATPGVGDVLKPTESEQKAISAICNLLVHFMHIHIHIQIYV